MSFTGYESSLKLHIKIVFLRFYYLKIANCVFKSILKRNGQQVGG